jgi:hypothetical protein
MNRIRLEVLKVKGIWRVTRSGALEMAFLTQAQAIKGAVTLIRELIEIGRTVTLKIKRPNGQIREERTYPRSSDPRRSKG